MMPRPLRTAAVAAAIVLSGCQGQPQSREEAPDLASTPCSLDPAASDTCLGVFEESQFADGASGTFVFDALLRPNLSDDYWEPRLHGNSGGFQDRKPLDCSPGNCERVRQRAHVIRSSTSAPPLSREALKGAYVIAAIRLYGANQPADSLYRLASGPASGGLTTFYLFVAKPIPPSSVVLPDADGRSAVARLEIYGLVRQGSSFTLQRANGPDRYIRLCHPDGFDNAPGAEFTRCEDHLPGGAQDTAVTTAGFLPLLRVQLGARSWDSPAWFTCAAGCCYGDFTIAF